MEYIYKGNDIWSIYTKVMTYGVYIPQLLCQCTNKFILMSTLLFACH